MKKYILALDEGTTSARAIIFNDKGRSIAVAQHEFSQIYPAGGFVEHDPAEILSAQYTAATEAIIISSIKADEIAAVGITNQRETTIVWDKVSGEPIYNAIVWQCRRTSDICEKLIADGYEEYITSTTGLKPDAYFSGTKIKWILDNVKGAREKAERGELLFGTVDTWLMWKMSGGKIFATDTTNASRTMLFDIHRLCWDEKLLDILDIPRSMLPEVLPSGSYFGDIDIMGIRLPIGGVAGDQQAALFGQQCWSEGNLKNTYGTGCFLLMNVGNTAVKSENGLVTTVAATLKGEAPQYALEGSVFIGGAVIQWLRDELKIIENAPESEKYALSVSDSGGVYIVPAFSGLGAPYWDMHARGNICGLTRGSSRAHIVRAALEAIAYQTNDLIAAMGQDCAGTISALKADGGAAKNEFLMQFQSSISDLEVIVPDNAEATALGAAYLAGLTCGIFESREALARLGGTYRSYMPDGTTDRQELLNGWRRAVKATRAFCNEE